MRGQTELPGLGTLTLYRTSETIAKQEGAAPALLPDLLLDNYIKLWDLTTLKERTTLRGHPGGIQALALTRDGGTLDHAADQPYEATPKRLPSRTQKTGSAGPDSNDAEPAGGKAAKAALFASRDQNYLAHWVMARLHRDRGDFVKAGTELIWFIRAYKDKDITDPEELLLVGLAAAELHISTARRPSCDAG